MRLLGASARAFVVGLLVQIPVGCSVDDKSGYQFGQGGAAGGSAGKGTLGGSSNGGSPLGGRSSGGSISTAGSDAGQAGDAAGGEGQTPGTGCVLGEHNCSGSCVSDDSPAHCGALCDACRAPTGGTATCVAGNCDFECGTLKKCGTECVSGCCVDTDCPAQSGKSGKCDSSSHSCRYDCAAGYKPCGSNNCIPEANCCSPSDCAGTCQTCSDGSCVAVKNADDTDSCKGTCDATGACKSKQGQTCQTAGSCIAGTTCAPDGYCCNTACTESCMACDLPGVEGTCSAVSSGAPHGNRASCGSDATCGGSCTGRSDGKCSYPTGACGAAQSCSGTSLQQRGTCSSGTCNVPQPTTCAGGYVCASNACLASCNSDSDCLPSYFCSQNTCHLDAKQVAVGSSRVCVLLVDGSVRCWGTGPLGDGTTNSSYTTPATVTGLQNVTAIDADNYAVLALRSDGTVSRWGSIQTSDGTLTDALTPVAIPGLSSVTAIATAGYDRNAALLSNKSAVGWGWNQNGAIGDGTTTFRASPVAVSLTNLTAISPGETFSCAVQNGAAFCWGSNIVGELGNGSTTSSLTPVQVLDLSLGVSAIAVSDSEHFACAIQNGNVRCWGFNHYGQLGNGMPTASTSTPVSTPVTATGVNGATALALGTDHTCALASGEVKCWGANESGELGIGTLQDASTPQSVNLPGTVTAIDAAVACTCAVWSNGSVWCWGGTGAFAGNAMVSTPQAAPPW